ncbi:unnamed protein product [Soboliphyme baturini]|uniref:Uncharacterized protein n=1 Tax=Soboliphyme baturini TaxID=241478 RepID=A0A183IJ54_9BILA|nr:unnamed protein product [Soboliphyme baturini]
MVKRRAGGQETVAADWWLTVVNGRTDGRTDGRIERRFSEAQPKRIYYTGTGERSDYDARTKGFRDAAGGHTMGTSRRRVDNNRCLPVPATIAYDDGDDYDDDDVVQVMANRWRWRWQ